MANLKLIEKQYIEDFLEMESGYVLDFSNNTLQSFVYESINIEIYNGEGYEENCSKANKIRQILKREPDLKVAQLLEDLLEYKSYKNTKGNLGKDTSGLEKKLEREIKNLIQRMKQPQLKKETEISDFVSNKEYDVFISHASEDKHYFVESLASALKDAGIKTWYDADQISWGESIRQSIDKGLINSRFCIVVISKDFFKKPWAGTYELNAIFQRFISEKNSPILPIWHNITIEEISQHNLTLPDIKAMNSSIHTLDQIVNAMKVKVSMYKNEL